MASLKKIKKLRDELAQRSKSTITSIINVQKELQTVKIAKMVGEGEMILYYSHFT
jgi:hypothetical protein